MTRYLLLGLIIALVVWLLTRSRRVGTASPPQDPPAVAQDMVECQRCGLHLPRGDALLGRGGGVYCCEEHRREQEQES